MSVDFSNEPIGKPRWCITRGGEIVQAWVHGSDSFQVVITFKGGGTQYRTVAGECVEGEMYPGDLVSFAPPECDAFTWKAPEPIKVGDWVEVVDAFTSACPVDSYWKVTEIHADGDARINDWWHHPNRLRKCDPPSATYRAFANAEEFKPHADRWITLVDGDVYMKVSDFSGTPDGIIVHVATFDKIINSKDFLDGFVFADTGEPCGVKVE